MLRRGIGMCLGAFVLLFYASGFYRCKYWSVSHFATLSQAEAYQLLNGLQWEVVDINGPHITEALLLKLPFVISSKLSLSLPLSMNCNIFADSLSFHVVLPSGQHLNLSFHQPTSFVLNPNSTKDTLNYDRERGRVDKNLRAFFKETKKCHYWKLPFTCCFMISCDVIASPIL